MGNTRQRNAVLRAVNGYCGHPTAEDVYSIVRKNFPNVGLGTVYRNLNILSENGVIRKISLPNEPARFDKFTHQHEHLICIKCGAITDIKEVELKLQDDMTEYDIISHSIVIYGVCPDCKTEK